MKLSSFFAPGSSLRSTLSFRSSAAPPAERGMGRRQSGRHSRGPAILASTASAAEGNAAYREETSMSVLNLPSGSSFRAVLSCSSSAELLWERGMGEERPTPRSHQPADSTRTKPEEGRRRKKRNLSVPSDSSLPPSLLFRSYPAIPAERGVRKEPPRRSEYSPIHSTNTAPEQREGKKESFMKFSSDSSLRTMLSFRSRDATPAEQEARDERPQGSPHGSNHSAGSAPVEGGGIRKRHKNSFLPSGSSLRAALSFRRSPETHAERNMRKERNRQRARHALASASTASRVSMASGYGATQMSGIGLVPMSGIYF
jgi:hypothetical protein